MRVDIQAVRGKKKDPRLEQIASLLYSGSSILPAPAWGRNQVAQWQAEEWRRYHVATGVDDDGQAHFLGFVNSGIYAQQPGFVRMYQWMTVKQPPANLSRTDLTARLITAAEQFWGGVFYYVKNQKLDGFVVEAPQSRKGLQAFLGSIGYEQATVPNLWIKALY